MLSMSWLLVVVAATVRVLRLVVAVLVVIVRQ
jgi:hypothetical protein